MRDVNFGWLLRYLHSNGASMFFLAVYVHIFRGLYYGSYKAPREVLWILGVIIYLLMMATAFMGYVLPWGQMSFCGATVITNLFTAIPLVGNTSPLAVGRLCGRRSDAQPLLLAALSAALHDRRRRRSCTSGRCTSAARTIPTASRSRTSSATPSPSRLTRRSRTCSALGVFLIFYAWFVFFIPNYLVDADNYNPGQPAGHAGPYRAGMVFAAVLRDPAGDPNKLVGVVCLFSGIACSLPAMARHLAGQVRQIPPGVPRVLLGVRGVCIGLGCLGSQEVTDKYDLGGAMLAFCYFGFLLIVLPLLGLFEKTKPLPASIADAVLAKGASAAQPAE